MKTEEKAQLHRVLRLMLSEGLTYRQVRVDDGTLAFVLEPSLEMLASFAPSDGVGRAEASLLESRVGAVASKNSSLNAVRQVLASEIELERIRRSGERRASSEPGTMTLARGRSAELQRAYAGLHQAKGQVVGKGGHGTSVGKPPVIRKDFFGRPVVPKTPAAEMQTAGTPRQSPQGRIWFKFNEGFTNAIRRPLRLRDLFTDLKEKR